MKNKIAQNLIKFLDKWKVLFSIILSIFVLLVQYRSCSISNEAINLTMEANNINKVTAEDSWSFHRNKFIEIDDELKDWEHKKNLKRNGISPHSIEDMEIELTKSKLQIPSKVMKLYKNRQEEYETLKDMLKVYQPFKERFSKIDLTLPVSPNLPLFSGTGNAVIRPLNASDNGTVGPSRNNESKRTKK